MKIEDLRPTPEKRVQFAWPFHVAVPEQPGCYALVNYSGEVLYVGLATKSIRDRMGAHLNTPEKRKSGALGVPYWIYYLERPDTEVHPTERGWMNQALAEDGVMPILNKVYSPL